MNRSLLTGFFPFPFGVSVHICHQRQAPQRGDMRCLSPLMRNLVAAGISHRGAQQRRRDVPACQMTKSKRTRAHLLDVLQDHVGVSVESLDSGQQLLVVPQRDEDLGLISDSLLEDGEGALGDLVLLQFTDLRLVELGFGDVLVLTRISDWGKGFWCLRIGAIKGWIERILTSLCGMYRWTKKKGGWREATEATS